MNKLLKDNSDSQPLLFKGAKTETKFSSQPTESKSGSCAQKLKQQDSGYTIIESLVAMIVVSVLMIAIAPVMAFSVATRVQARRTELAAMAGRAYIDGLRSGSIKFNDPDPKGKGFPAKYKVTPKEFANEPAPPSKDPRDLYCIDMDGGDCSPTSNKDFYVQGVWLNPDPSIPLTIPPNNPTSKGYQLLVRVYRADSFADGVTLWPTPNSGRPKQSIVGSGLGDKTMPVVEMSAEIPATGKIPDDLEPYKSLCTRLQAGSDKCKN